jgi:hypothetical protein
MLAALQRLCPAAQLAWEAPMACGYGACYGCAVEIEGELRRLCVEGPVLHGGTHGSPMSPLLHAQGVTEQSGAPAGQSPAPPATRIAASGAQNGKGA